MGESDMEQHPCPVFIFYNLKSGGNFSNYFKSNKIRELILEDPLCHVYIFDITEGDSGIKPGFLKLKQCILENKCTVRIIVVGGDGTVLWCISELDAHRIDYDDIAIGIVPFGTGNDFAKSYGWQFIKLQNFFDKYLKTLRKVIKLFIDSPIVKHDLWKIRISVNDDGHFSKINQTNKKEEIIYEYDSPVKTLEFTMSNYFSVGVESKIGRGFDKYRGLSRFKNKSRYLIEGFKKIFARRIDINNIVESMEQKVDNEWKTIFTSDLESSDPKLKNAVSLIMLNIPSFSSGLNPWNTEKCGIEQSNLEFTDQLVGDGALEILSYSTLISIALNYVIRSNRANKISQGKGPWRIIIKQLPPNFRFYFQIDGEFRVAYQPTSIEVNYHRSINVITKNSQILSKN